MGLGSRLPILVVLRSLPKSNKHSGPSSPFVVGVRASWGTCCGSSFLFLPQNSTCLYLLPTWNSTVLTHIHCVKHTTLHCREYLPKAFCPERGMQALLYLGVLTLHSSPLFLNLPLSLHPCLTPRPLHLSPPSLFLPLLSTSLYLYI